MYCTKCGKKIDDNSVYCPECGYRIKTPIGAKIYKGKCVECGATMEYRNDESELYCPYCGSKQFIFDSDIVALEKIKSRHEEEMKKLDITHEEKRHEVKKKEDSLHSYRRSRFKTITIIFAVICLLSFFLAFRAHKYLAAFIALSQVILLVLSWLSGMQIIDLRVKNIHMALGALALILIIPFFVANSMKVYERLKWPNEGIAQVLPDPKSRYGHISIYNNDRLSIDIEKSDSDDYLKYVDKCIDKGFVIDGIMENSYYEAYNEEGYKLRVTKYSDEYHISLDRPIMMNIISWPLSELAGLIPEPESFKGKIISESNDIYRVYIGDMDYDAYRNYVDMVMDKGFNTEYDRSEKHFSAKDTYGNSISVDYEGYNTMYISLEKSEEVIPEIIDTPDTVITDEPVISDNPVTEANGVNPELKKFLDEYEAFIDEYIAFMKKYEESDDPLAMLNDYAKMMERYAAMEKSLDAYNEDDMSSADLAYYTEVMGRCSAKLLSYE